MRRRKYANICDGCKKFIPIRDRTIVLYECILNLKRKDCPCRACLLKVSCREKCQELKKHLRDKELFSQASRNYYEKY